MDEMPASSGENRAAAFFPALFHRGARGERREKPDEILRIKKNSEDRNQNSKKAKENIPSIPTSNSSVPDSALIFSRYFVSVKSAGSAISVVHFFLPLENRQKAHPRILYSKTQTAAKKARRADRTKGVKYDHSIRPVNRAMRAPSNNAVVGRARM